MKLEFLDGFSKNNQILNFMKIHHVGAELFHADRRTDGHDEAKSRFTQCANVSYDMILKCIASVGNK